MKAFEGIRFFFVVEFKVAQIFGKNLHICFVLFFLTVLQVTLEADGATYVYQGFVRAKGFASFGLKRIGEYMVIVTAIGMDRVPSRSATCSSFSLPPYFLAKLWRQRA